jgi:hypothetical protein
VIFADAAYAKNPQALKDAGFVGIARYGPPSIYAMPEEECQGYRDAELGAGLIFEVQHNRALGGYAKGHADAEAFNAYADDCGAPPELRLLYNLWDPAGTAPTPEQMPAVVAYARGWVDGSARPTMPYCYYDLGERVCAPTLPDGSPNPDHVHDAFWQTVGWAGFGEGSGGSIHVAGDGPGVRRRVSRYAAMVQDSTDGRLPGADVNHVMVERVDWLFGGPFPHPTASEEEPMTTTYLWHIFPDADAARVYGTGVFKALDCSDFVLPLSPDEVQLYHDIQAWHAATSPDKPPLVVDQINPPAAAIASRVLLPRGAAVAAVAQAVLAVLPPGLDPGADGFDERVAAALATISTSYTDK